MSIYSPKDYWANLAQKFASVDAEGLTPVLHPNSPSWFNRLIDDLQCRAVRRAVAVAAIPAGARILDVGCGTGRWVRRYQQLGFRVTGMDATLAMLHVARAHGTAAALIAGEACRLPFPDSRFDAVSDITVTQHIPTHLQGQALGEMMRVVRPGGRLILMELIRGQGAHIFPRKPQDWIEQATACGAKLVGWFGQEYLLLDRLFVHVAQGLVGRNRDFASAGAISQRPSSQHSMMARRIYWGFRRVTAPISVCVDPMADWICPPQVATHGVFVFRK
jgi:ubiquinone/menaquinone biosynthesis C-methylase UbiE